RQHWQRYWLVGPLDGTKEFIKRNGEFNVNIALIDHGKPILGVVYAPVMHVMYSAAEGKAWKEECGVRMWEESYWLPQVAVGALDIGGTGLFDAEYRGASK
ncbi:inositol monophosphatase family protein, partial [Escherichia coli]